MVLTDFLNFHRLFQQKEIKKKIFLIKDQQARNSNVNTNLRLTNTLFNGKNYISWARAVSLSLSGKGQLLFINGKIKNPGDKDPPKSTRGMANKQRFGIVLASPFNGVKHCLNVPFLKNIPRNVELSPRNVWTSEKFCTHFSAKARNLTNPTEQQNCNRIPRQF